MLRTAIAATTRIAVSGSPTSPGPWPELRGSPAATAVGTGVAPSDGEREREDRPRRPRPPRATSRRPRRRSGTASTTHQTGPRRSRRRPRPSATVTARVVPRWSTASSRIASGRRAWTRSAVAAGRDGGSPRRRRRGPACRTRRRGRCCSAARSAAGPACRGGGRPARGPARPRPCPPTRARRPRGRRRGASASTAIRSRPSAISNAMTWRLSSNAVQRLARPGLEPGPAADERPMVLVLELVLGVDAAGDRRRSGPGRPGRSRGASATGTTGVAARIRPTRALSPMERSRIHAIPSSARPTRTRTVGSTPG